MLIMAKKQIENLQYDYLLGKIRNALPLEYAIRAAETDYPDEIARLKEIDKKIRAYLIELGATEQEVDRENLSDFIWDMLQVCQPRVRMDGRTLHPELNKVVMRCIDGVINRIPLNKADLECPALKFFRVCDLLAEFDLLSLIRVVKECLAEARKISSETLTSLERLVPLNIIRRPVELHPGVDMGIYRNDSSTKVWIEIEATAEFELRDIDRQMDEFLYQLALQLQFLAGRERDELSMQLFERLLQKEVFGSWRADWVDRVTAITAALTGLHCWDLHKRKGMRLDDAIQAAMHIHPVSFDAARRNYKQANIKISKYRKKFKDATNARFFKIAEA